MTKGELFDHVLAALDRRNDAQAKALLPVWLTLAEGDIFNVLRAGWMARRGDAIFTTELDTLPPSIIQIQGVILLNDNVPEKDILRLVGADGEPITAGGGIQLLAAGSPRDTGVNATVVRPLEAVGPENVTAAMLQPGTPTHYTIEGRRIRTFPWPGTFIRVNVSYYSRGDVLKNDGDTNETLYYLPSAYIYAMLVHASVFYGDTNSEASWRKTLVDTLTVANANSYNWQGTGFVARLG